jgi:ATP-binding cassette subfamily B (MDR/TAP) protein 1
MTFIVGKSGSGKSTVSNLLLRFYQATSGDITIDGQAIQDLDIKWLRNNITLVQQQSILFNETIFKNIALGRTDHNKVSHSQVKQAISFAALDETIKDMDKGLDTLVGAGGNSLSGGQRQRVALARARLRDAPVLILDEATSALDETSRKRVMKAVRSWRRDKTTIIITHDITQIEPSDFVYVMENGCVVEVGYRSALECTVDGHLSKVAANKDGSVEDNVEPLNSTPDAGPLDDIPDLTTMKPKHLNVSDIELPRPECPSSRLAVSRQSYRRGRSVQEMASTLAPIATQGTRMSRMSFMADQDIIRQPEPTYANSPISPVAVQESNPRYYFEESQVVEMSEISQSNSSATSQSQSSPSSKSFLRSTSIRKRNRRAEVSTESKKTMSLSAILKTVWSRLTWDKRVVLLLGFLAAAVHAGAVPVFSWIFANLLQAIFDPVDRTHKAMLWSVSILALAAVDATAAFTMHYFLEICGQAWVDSLRCDAMGRIMDQPKAWYDKDRGKLSQLIETLDRSPEEMRNLVGRFACFVFVALVMIVVTIMWALIVCWKLTLVVFATGPFMYGVTRGFESVSTIWEGKSNDAGEAASSIFTETFANIKLVRALTLEGYFHEKYFKATKEAAKVGTQRAAFSGLFFGMADAGIIFITGRFLLVQSLV